MFRPVLYAFVVAVFASFLCASVRAQDAAPPAAGDKPAAKAFAEGYKLWQAKLEEGQAIRKKYVEADAAGRQELGKQMMAIFSTLEKMVPKMKELAQAAYVETPNGDPEVTKFIIMMLKADLLRDKFDEVNTQAKLLLENGCKDAGVFDAAGIAAFNIHDFEHADAYLKKAKEAGSLSRTAEHYLSIVEEYKKLWKAELALRKKEAEADDLPRVRMKTSKGELVIELFENEAPQAVGNFVSLVEKGYYDGLIFHRVLPGFMAQGGCPDGTGGGGPGYKIYCECQYLLKC